MILKGGKLLLEAPFLHDEIELVRFGLIKKFQVFTWTEAAAYWCYVEKFS